MRSPETPFIPPVGDEFQENKANGMGYWVYLPTPGSPLQDALPAVANYGDFLETPDIVDELIGRSAVLIKGSPGSGKSHLVRDLQTAAVLNNLPTFCLTVQINGGKASGVANVEPLIEDFRDKVHETGGGLVILDNIDYPGYKSSSRTRTRAVQYARDLLPVVEELIEDRDISVLGIAHDDAWREGKWTWADEEIDGPANAILEAFPARLTFEGKMALEGLAHLLWGRNLRQHSAEETISIGEAAQIMRTLQQNGRANFFYANHLPAALFLKDPEAAIAQIERGRAERRGQS